MGIRLLTKHKVQVVIALSLFFFFLKITLLGTGLAFFQHAYPWTFHYIIIISLIGAIIFACLAFLLLFLWKKSPAEVEQIEPLLAALVEGVIIIDRHWKIQFINQRARHYLNLEAKELVGHTITSLDQPICENLIIESYKLKKPLMAVITSEHWGEILDVTAISRNKQSFIILVIQNQTCLHKATEFARDFIANASHELKTPITIVKGFAETLHDHPELSKEITQEITKRIVDNCDRMVSLVKNLLSLTNIDETILSDRLHKCNPKDIAEAARATVLELHPSAEIVIKESQPISMVADKELVLQALVNLLDNGIKYSGEHPKIEMHLSQDANETRIEVRDFGRGIAKENFDRIFERFYAVDKQLSRSLGGYGLGLSITKRIMEKHHGRIELRSKEGEGSSFTLVFPKSITV